MNKVKVGTIIAGVIDLLIGLVVTVGSVLGFFMYSSLVDPLVVLASLGTYVIMLFFVFSITCIMGITIFIFSIFEIRIGAKNDSGFYKSRATIITYIVLDFVFGALLLLAGFMVSYFVIIAAAIMFISAILKIIDVSIFNHKLKKGKVDVKNYNVQAHKDANNNPDLNPSFKLKLELARLDNLKAEGTISETEYESMRQNIINSYGSDQSAKATPAQAESAPQGKVETAEQPQTDTDNKKESE